MAVVKGNIRCISFSSAVIAWVTLLNMIIPSEMIDAVKNVASIADLENFIYFSAPLAIKAAQTMPTMNIRRPINWIRSRISSFLCDFITVLFMNFFLWLELYMFYG